MKKARYDRALDRLERSREYPESLGTGKPSNPDYRLQDFLALLCYQSAGMETNAAEVRERIKKYSGPAGGPEAVRAAIEQWYRKVWPSQTELKALQELSSLVRGPRTRRQ
jgi:hypothetical protein